MMTGIATLNPFSPQAAAISHLFVAILIVLVAIFVLVTTLLTVAIVRYRDRPGAPEAQQVFGSHRLEIAWTVGPIILLTIIGLFMVRTIQASDPPKTGKTPDLR